MTTLLVLSAVGNEGRKGTIMVVHHTDCGLLSISDAEIAECLKKCVGSEEEKALLDGMVFGSFVEWVFSLC
jgi:carbonic anhydrase